MQVVWLTRGEVEVKERRQRKSKSKKKKLEKITGRSFGGVRKKPAGGGTVRGHFVAFSIARPAQGSPSRFKGGSHHWMSCHWLGSEEPLTFFMVSLPRTTWPHGGD